MPKVSSSAQVIPRERLEARRARKNETATKRRYSQGRAAGSGFSYPFFDEEVRDKLKGAAFIECYETIDLMIDTAETRLHPDEDDEAFANDFPIPTADARVMARAIAEQIVIFIANKANVHMVPRFEAAGDGGVGLHWKRSRLELLISVPPAQENSILYYGDTPSGVSIKGSLLRDSPVGFLAEWIVEHELPS